MIVYSHRKIHFIVHVTVKRTESNKNAKRAEQFKRSLSKQSENLERNVKEIFP